MQEPIAVIGSSCRFPGGASSPSKLWELLKQPRDVLRDFPSDRLNLDAFHHDNGENHGSTNVINKSYLLEEDPRTFDASFFNINPVEADSMDPQQRLVLESVYECIEAAGYTLCQMQGSMTSVFVGVMTNDWKDIQQRDLEIINHYHATGTAMSILSNRVSYCFDLHGPSLTLDTACSSSLAALHLGVQSLRNGESTTSLISGVNLLLDSSMYISESKLHMLSPSSRSRMWDAAADGYARGEGVSTVLLKPLSKALEDGDHIECVIRETGMNSDGRTPGITMPSPTAQAALICQTYRNAGLDPVTDRPQYFECHGTGTLAGDPREARAVWESFFPPTSVNEDTSDDTKLYCGSIKTIIGHLEGCAGLAGLLKVSLALQNGFIPPNLLFNTLNPAIKPFYDHLQVPTSLIPWPEPTKGPRRASLNSFGFGGTNVHAIVEQFVPESDSSISKEDTDLFVGPLLLSAERESSLSTTIKDFADFIRSNPAVDLEDLAYVTSTRRTAFPVRASFAGNTRDKLLESLDASLKAAESGTQVGTKALPSSELPAILGIFTGQGAQWASMGRRMVETCRQYRESIEMCEAALKDIPDAPTWSLMKELMAPEGESRMHEAAISQPLCTATQIAVVDVLRAAGIGFRGVVGHSSGEIGAAYAAGILSAADAIRVAYYRGLHCRLAGGDGGELGAMMATGMDFDEATSFCDQFKGRIGVAASNSQASTTLSGDADVIAKAKQVLDEKGTFARLLKVDKAYHSHHMLPCAEAYLSSMKACNITVHPPSEDCIWISSVYGHADLLEDEEELEALGGQYWVDNMTKPVLFSEAVECSLWRAGPFDMAVEVGPHPALKGPATQRIKATLGSVLPYTAFLSRGDHDVDAFSRGIGYVWERLGSVLDFAGYRRAFYASEPKMLKGLPTYSWNHDKVHWREGRPSRRYRLGSQPHEVLGRRLGDDTDLDMRWRNIIRVEELPWTRGHVFQGLILFPTSGYMAMAIQAAMEVAAGRSVSLIEIRDFEIPRALTLKENHPGVETIFSLRLSEAGVNSDRLEAEFICYSCSITDIGGAMERNCSGSLTIEFGDSSTNPLPTRPVARPGLNPVESEALYDFLLNLGLDYQGVFRGIKSAQRALHYARTKASWSPADLGDKYVMHPGPLDVAIHSVIGAFASPQHDPSHSPYLPVKVDRLALTPSANYIGGSGDVEFEVDCFVTETTLNSFSGDFHIICPDGSTGLQVEGLKLKLFTEAQPSDDRVMFSKTIWKADLLGSSANLPDTEPDAATWALSDAIERTALFFLKKIFEPLSDSAISEWKSYHKEFYRTAKTVLLETADGKHPTLKREWLQDTEDVIMAFKDKYTDQADIKLLHAVAQALPDALNSDVDLLHVMSQDDMLANLHTEGRTMKALGPITSDVMKDISHKFPLASILEIGAGVGATTSRVLSSIGGAYGQYTYTDASSDSLETAKQRIGFHNGKVVYKVLDISKDPVEQGFAESSQDVIVASHALHATANMHQTITHLRKLLKPGGYLVLTEITGMHNKQMSQLHMMFLMGGLPSWWLGVDGGRTDGPGMTLNEWDELLQQTEFTGADKYTMDTPVVGNHTSSVIVAQATDERVAMLMDPLSFLDELPLQDHVVIVGGKTISVSRMVKMIEKLLLRFTSEVFVAASIDDLNLAEHIGANMSVIYMGDLEKPLFSEAMTDDRLQKLQALFSNAENMLWITSSRFEENPYANMSVGFGRAVRNELLQLNLQYLDVGKRSSVFDARYVVESFLKLMLPKTAEFTKSPLLWSIEPELALDGDVLRIPRLVPDNERNDRFNSTRRSITKDIKPGQAVVKVVQEESGIAFEENDPWLSTVEVTSNQGAKLNVDFSVAIPFSTRGRFILCSGTLVATGKPALTITTNHASEVSAQVDQILELDDGCTPNELSLIANTVAANLVHEVARKQSSGSQGLLVYNASPEFASVLKGVNGACKVVFANSNQIVGDASAVKIHPRMSSRTIQHLLPPKVDFVISLGRKSDPIANHLLSLYPGVRFDVDNLGYRILGKQDLEKACQQIRDSSDVTISQNFSIVSAQDLASSSSAHITYPAIIDWTNRDRPLAVMTRPIHGKGLFSSEKTYLMAGLVSDLGLSICRWMIQNGAKYIVLTSRSGTVDQTWLDELERLGGNVTVHKMDVSQRDSVKSVCDTIKATLPAVGGVCSGAAIFKDQVFLNMDNKDFVNDVYAPKVDGSVHLDEQFQNNDLDFFIMFSSVSSVAGNPGQSSYSAACQFQSTLANQRRAKGLSAASMCLGVVSDVGYLTRGGPDAVAKVVGTEFLRVSESEVHTIFAEAVAASKPSDPGFGGQEVEITTGVRYQSSTSKATLSWMRNPRMSNFIILQKEDSTETSNSNLHGDSSAAAIQFHMDSAGTVEEATAALLTAFANKIESMLQMTPGSLNAEAPLLEAGIDSLFAVYVRAWFLEKTHVDVPVLQTLRGASALETCSTVAVKYLAAASKNKEKKEAAANAAPEAHATPAVGTEELPPATTISGSVSDISVVESLSSDKKDTDVSVTDAGDLVSEAETTMDESIVSRVGKLSHSQSRIWFHDQMSEDRTQYNSLLTYDIEGAVHAVRLKRAVAVVVDHHSALRTCFFAKPGTGEPTQGILMKVPECFTHIREAEATAETYDNECTRLKNKTWALSRGELIEVVLVSHTPQRHSLLLSYHHIALDGVSFAILLRDLNLAYQGKTLPVAGPQYIDIAMDERSRDESELSDKIEFWTAQHSPPADVLPLFEFAEVNTRPAPRFYTNIDLFKETGSALAEKVRLASKKLQVTPFHFYLAAMQVLFYRLLNTTDICIGVTDSNRKLENAQTIGFFLNILPIRLRVDSTQTTFADLVKNASNAYYSAHANSGVPLDTILQKTNVERHAAHTPLFQVAMNFRQGSFTDLSMGNSPMTFKSAYDARSPYDFAFSITPINNTCYVQLVSRADLYSHAATEMVYKMYTTLLEDAADNVEKPVSQCRVYKSSGVQAALEMGRVTQRDFGWPKTLSERFEKMEELYPNHIALKDATGSLTYSQLLQRVQSTAALLIKNGAKPGARAAVLCEPTNNWVIAMLAILRAGGIYIPLDATMPRERLATMVGVCEPSFLLYQASTQTLAHNLNPGNITILNVEDVNWHEESTVPNLETPDGCTFMLFTSGTTGIPKGIRLSSIGIINYLASKADYLGIGQEVVLQHSSLGFDMAIAQAFNAIANGGTLVIASKDSRGDPVALTSLIVEEKVSFTLGCPTEYLMWLRSGSEELRQQKFWKFACSGGEAVTDRFRTMLASISSSPQLINCYGPTEISCCATMLRMPVGVEIEAGSIGKQSNNVGICILDPSGDAVPLGLPGEICVSGVGVALGYLNAEATAKKFIENPSVLPPGSAEGLARMYRTGDKGVWLEDGSVRYLGRMNDDTTVKVRGLRVDLDDVANTILRELSGVLSDVVATVRGTGEDAFLVAHVVLHAASSLDEPTLLKLTHETSLPRYMRPSRMIELSKLPMSTNGKADRRSIAAMELPPQQAGDQPVATTLTLKQGELRLLWTSVLRSDVRLTPESDFFMVGGTSLALMSLQDAIKRNMLVNVSIRDMYSHSTLSAMTQLVVDKANNMPTAAPIVWGKETALPVDLNLDAEGTVSDEEMEILLTGATGFLGGAILRSLIANPKVKHIHCLAAGATSSTSTAIDAKVTFYDGNLNQQRLGLDIDTFTQLERTVDRIILAGAHGHCLNSYNSLRAPIVDSTKSMALLALSRRIPIHFISSNRVTLIHPDSQAALPPISLADHTPPTDGSEGFTAAKWASEVFLERLTNVTSATSEGLPVTVHRACAVVGDDAPLEDALNALLRFSNIMRAVPRMASLNMGGYFDFKRVEVVAQEVVDSVIASRQTGLSFQHHSGGVRVPPSEFKTFMEGFYGGEFIEVEMEEWMRKALDHGIEELILAYLRAVTERGETLIFPFMGNTL